MPTNKNCLECGRLFESRYNRLRCDKCKDMCNKARSARSVTNSRQVLQTVDSKVVSKIKCSICRQEGHNMRSCKQTLKSPSPPKIDVIVKKEVKEIKEIKEVVVLKTEDTGKIFEMAICLAYNIPYDGKYKYSMELPEQLKPRLSKLIEMFPKCRHSAKKGNRYDFTSLTDENIHLSAKSTKKGIGRVAPQVLGQSQPTKFCKIIKIEYTTIADLKKYIQNNIENIIPILVNYTFDCPNIYYNQDQNKIRYITLNDTPIKWDSYTYKWTCQWSEWNNSSTLKIIIDNKEYALLEFQFHTKSRTNMAIRWFYDNFLTIFKKNLVITDF